MEFSPSRGGERAGDRFETAQALEPGEIRGFLSSRSDDAFYGNALPEASQNFRDYYLLETGGGEYEITLTAVERNSAFDCTVYDADLRACAQVCDNPQFSVELEAGRYYLCVENPQRAGGDYLLRVEAVGGIVPTGAAQGASGDFDGTVAVGESARLLPGRVEADACWWGSTDPGVVAVSRDGEIRGVSAGEARVAAIPMDGSAAVLFSIAVR